MGTIAVSIANKDVQWYLKVFMYFQIVDLLTTLLGLKLGLDELSPFIRVFLRFGPVIAVIASKLVALLLCGLCLWLNKSHLIRKINYLYAAVLVWNLGLLLLVRPRL
jgi:hypothetical protein